MRPQFFVWPEDSVFGRPRELGAQFVSCLVDDPVAVRSSAFRIPRCLRHTTDIGELLQRLGQLALHTGVLTRNSRASVTTTFGLLGWTFDTVLTREDAPAKPDPTGVLAICRDWNVAPADVLFVGDYLFDLQAGHNAGTRAVLFVPDLATRPEALPEWSDEADWLVSGENPVMKKRGNGIILTATLRRSQFN